MVELHQTLHDSAGVCLWTILAMVAFIVLVVIFLVHSLGQTGRKVHSKKKVKDYNKKMEQLYGDAGAAAAYGGISAAEQYFDGSEETILEESAYEADIPVEAATSVGAATSIEEGASIAKDIPDEEIILDKDDTPVRLFDR